MTDTTEIEGTADPTQRYSATTRLDLSRETNPKKDTKKCL